MKLNTRYLPVPLIAVIIGMAIILMPASATETSVETTSDDQSSIAITIYNDGTGLVKDTRSLTFPEGQFSLIFMDVASQIDPTSVHFISNTNPDSIAILEQNYEYDLVSTAALFERHIDREITVMTSDGRTITGRLLSYGGASVPQLQPSYDSYGYSNYSYSPPVTSGGDIVVETSNGIVIINNAVEVQFEELPEGLITRPTLRWSLICGQAGPNECEMSYLTNGIAWNANYVAVVNQDDDELGLSGWVTITNNSGTAYHDAVLKLVAGEVHRVTPEPMQYARGAEMMYMDGAAPTAPGFEEESFFEYHLYTLQRPATVMNNQQKQINLLEGEGINAQKIFVFDPGYQYYGRGDTAEGDIAVRLRFMNSEENSLGIPLPKGLIRVYKEDSSGSLQFIGEDQIDHTPRDEEIEIFLGEAFDIVGERSVLDRRMIRDDLWEYDVRVTIRNHKDERVEIVYWDHVWGDWSVTTATHEYEQKDASTVEFVIPVSSDGETICEYTIRRGW